jgi:hypothetical protein
METNAQPVFGPDVVSAVLAHMNTDHPDDSLLICKALGGQPGAASARATGLDDLGMDFVAVVGGQEVPVRVPWSERLTERPQIRAEVVRMYRESALQLGIEPREAEATGGHPGGR